MREHPVWALGDYCREPLITLATHAYAAERLRTDEPAAGVLQQPRAGRVLAA